MHPRRGAAIALASGLGVIGVLATGIAFRKDIAAAWHLHRLETNEGYLARIIEEPDGSSADVAIRRYLETPEGKDTLFLVHAQEMARRGLPFFESRHANHVSRGVIWLDEAHFRRCLGCCDRKLQAPPHPVQNVSRLRRAARYLPLLEGTEFRWPDDPALRLETIPRSRAAELVSQPNLDLARAGPWIWWFERLPEPPAKSAR